MLSRLKKIYTEFPPLFWIIVGTLFIDSIGSTLLFPFFALYITQKFGVGMTEAGILLGMSSLFGLFGSIKQAHASAQVSTIDGRIASARFCHPVSSPRPNEARGRGSG